MCCPSMYLQVEVDRRLFSLADEQLFPDLRGQLGVSLDQLERCQKALSDFLEEKRSAMPRFYFIGDEDLLEILGQVRDKYLIERRVPWGLGVSIFPIRASVGVHIVVIVFAFLLVECIISKD